MWPEEGREEFVRPQSKVRLGANKAVGREGEKSDGRLPRVVINIQGVPKVRVSPLSEKTEQ